MKLFFFVLIAFYTFTIQSEVIRPAGGSGSYTTTLPSHQLGPSKQPIFDQSKNPWEIVKDWEPATPHFSEAFFKTGKPVTTHKFWSSIAWEFLRPSILPDGSANELPYVPFSNVLTNFPFMMKLTADGMKMQYNANPSLSPVTKKDGSNDVLMNPKTGQPIWGAYSFDYRDGDEDVVVKIEGLETKKTKVDSYSDWMVTTLWQDETNPSTTLKATFGYGSPYVFYEKSTSGNVTFQFRPGTRLWYENDGTLVITREDARSNYAIFAPSGSTWEYTLTNDVLRHIQEATLVLPEGKNYFSVAALPDEVNQIIRVNTEGLEGFPLSTPLSEIPLKKEFTADVQPVTVIYQDYFGNFGGYLSQLGGYDSRLMEQKGSNYELSPQLLDLIEQYRKHAFAFPTNTSVSWKYDKDKSALSTTYRIDTVLKEPGNGNVNTPLVAYFPHQWTHIPDFQGNYTYQSPRGPMKVKEGSSFTINLPFNGTLPYLPNLLGQEEMQSLNKYLDLVTDPTNWQAPTTLVQDGVADTYFNGKELARLANLVPIAKQAGREDLAEQYLEVIREQLTDWLDASDAEKDVAIPPGISAKEQVNYAKKYFYYDKDWNALIGYPASFSSNTELNDHHFHYGYLIFAAATLAREDKQWAEKYKNMVHMLIKDTANWDRNDKQFPFLRHFDVFPGFSVANGHTNFSSGTNQESSSESMNFSSALILWGSEMNEPEIRDMGIYLYVNENAAIQNYWFNKDGLAFPKQAWFLLNGNEWRNYAFDQPSLGIVWASKGDYATWFGQVPNFIHGINFLPLTGSSFYLTGVNDKIKTIISNLKGANDRYLEQGDSPEFQGKLYAWSDLMWSAQALYDPDQAAVLFQENEDYPWEGATLPEKGSPQVYGEKGESKAHTYHWIYNLKEAGIAVRDVTANTPHYAVFEKKGKRTYIVYNPSSEVQEVLFSDGKTMKAQPQKLTVE